MKRIVGRGSTVYGIVTVYVVFSGIWIYLSDIMLGQIVSDPVIATRLSIYKGFLFILITAGILIFLIGRYTRSMNRDMAERIRAEKEASLFRTLVEYTRDPVYILDPRDGGKMVYANQAACSHYGLTLEELLQMRIPDWDPDFDVADLMPLLEEMKRGKVVRFETTHRIASGKLVPVEVTANYLVHDGRELSTGYFCDISERKAMEAALKDSEARYRALSQEFQALLDCIPDGLTLLSPDMRILWVNSVGGQSLGLTATEQIDRHCYKIRHGLDSPCPGCLVRDTFATGKPQWMIRMVGTPPNEHMLELRSIPIKDDGGQVVKVFEVSRDITELKKAEAERLELERTLLHARKLESLGILAGGIAHDFNNILTGILGNLSLLRFSLNNDDAGLTRLDRCESAVKQATGLAKQLLTFAKGGEPVRKVIDPARVIETSVPFALRGSRVASEVMIADDLWPVDADEAQIGQVISNLRINADQAMPRGGVVRVEAVNDLLGRDQISTLEAGPYVRVSVCDHGNGIPPEHLDRIFDPYFTTKGSGTGLGLTSVYSIVKKHGGEVLVRSSVGTDRHSNFIFPPLRG